MYIYMEIWINRYGLFTSMANMYSLYIKYNGIFYDNTCLLDHHVYIVKVFLLSTFNSLNSHPIISIMLICFLMSWSVYYGLAL